MEFFYYLTGRSVIYAILCLLVALIGRKRNVGYWALFGYSFIFSPLVGLIIGLVSKRLPELPENPEITELINEGDLFLLNNQYEKALEKYLRVIEISPKLSNTMYNISTIYSILENSEMSIKYLDKAVKQGFKDIKRVKRDKRLMYLRSQPEYTIFASNGFRLTKRISD